MATRTHAQATRTHAREKLIPTDQVIEILKRYRAGYRVKELADAFDVSPSAVAAWSTDTRTGASTRPWLTPAPCRPSTVAAKLGTVTPPPSCRGSMPRRTNACRGAAESPVAMSLPTWRRRRDAASCSITICGILSGERFATFTPRAAGMRLPAQSRSAASCTRCPSGRRAARPRVELWTRRPR